MATQLHLTGAKARLAIISAAAAAQAAVAAGQPAPAPRPIPWSGFSGRGVRLRTIGADAKEAAERAAALAVGPDGAVGAYQRLRARECLERCIVEVTRDREVVEPGAAKWIKVTQADLSGAGKLDGYTLDALFTPKDIDVLAAWFRENHDASQADLEAITGGAIETADNDG